MHDIMRKDWLSQWIQWGRPYVSIRIYFCHAFPDQFAYSYPEHGSAFLSKGITMSIKSGLIYAALILLYAPMAACNSGITAQPTMTQAATIGVTPTVTPTLTATPTFVPTVTQTPTVTKTPLPSLTPTNTPIPTFAELVLQLDTPSKLSSYLLPNYYSNSTFHNGCIALSPEELYASGMKGDCKDYATFSTYVLRQHNYSADTVVFIWYDQKGTRNGHRVAIYQDLDGILRYISNGQIMGQVRSVSDLLEQEKVRLRASRMGNNRVLHGNELDGCLPNWILEEGIHVERAIRLIGLIVTTEVYAMLVINRGLLRITPPFFPSIRLTSDIPWNAFASNQARPEHILAWSLSFHVPSTIEGR
jgi:hypothetical protein